jgi:hypothetical protein
MIKVVVIVNTHEITLPHEVWLWDRQVPTNSTFSWQGNGGIVQVRTSPNGDITRYNNVTLLEVKRYRQAPDGTWEPL